MHPGKAPVSVIKPSPTPSRGSREKVYENNKSTNSNRDQSLDYWGHKLVTKASNTTRILAINVNGIGVKHKNEKSEALRRWITENEVDVTCISETNVNWAKVRTYHTLWERTRTWFEHRIIGVSYNTCQKIQGRSRKQQGGTATLLKDDIAHRHRDNGFDMTGLGRWSWVRIAGKQGCITRFVTVYCPNKGSKGLQTVYAQQLTELSEEPTYRFWTDLGKAVLRWQSEGEQIILSGDWNEDIQTPLLNEWMSTLGLKEAVTSLHEGRAPATYHRGTLPIDGIFMSEDIVPDRAGYLGFGEVPGDHRGIWIDVSNTELLGYNANNILTPKARRLKLEDPRVVKKYLTVVDKLFREKRVYSRLKKLQNMRVEKEMNIDRIQRDYETLDTIRVECMTLAEKQCRKFKRGGVLWSPRIQEARDTILFWTLLRKKRRKCHVSTRRILRLKKRLKIQKELQLSDQDIDIRLSKSYEEYKKLKGKAADIRLTYQEALAQSLADKKGGDAVTQLRALQDREKLRLQFGRIRATIKEKKTSTTKIQIRTSKGVQEITQMLSMEAYILQENEAKFHQTEGWSPLLEGTLLEDLGLMGDGPRVPDVLNGTYVPPQEVSDATKLWLKNMAIPNNEQRQWVQSSYEDFQKGWRKVKERTTSGSLHFGHFKAAVESKNVGKVHYIMSLIPMISGFSPRRWKQGTDVMILKAPEVYFLDKLRTIVLYEADFNHENRRIGKDAMKSALQSNKIAAEQFSRPGRSAQDNALAKRLVFDHFRFLKRPFGMCACDLASCYDRVVHTAASLALQRVGVPLPRLKCMFGTIQNLAHHVRTAYGRSTNSIGGTSPKFSNMP